MNKRLLTAIMLLSLLSVSTSANCTSGGGEAPDPPPPASPVKIGDGAFPKFSPDGSLIAFTLEGVDPDDPNGIGYDVYTIRPDGTGAVCLTGGKPAFANTGWRGQPFWHPSGDYIVFTAENAGYPRAGTGVTARPGLGRNHNVWIMTSDGGSFWQMTDYADNWGVIRPSFSRDGSLLYWNEEFSMEKYPQGKPTDPDDDIRTPGHQGHPGSYWGWESFRYREGEELGAWRMKLADFALEDGEPVISNIRSVQLPEGFTLIEGAGLTPSNDGLILSAADLEETGGRGLWGDIYISDLEGNLIARLTDTTFIHDENPEFSPDGEKVLWNASRGDPGEGEELWVMNADGSGKERLTFFTDPGRDEYDPKARQITESSWSPDGRTIVFGRVSQESRGGIHIPSALYLLTLD